MLVCIKVNLDLKWRLTSNSQLDSKIETSKTSRNVFAGQLGMFILSSLKKNWKHQGDILTRESFAES